MKKTKVIIFCCTGQFQSHLINRIHQEFDLLGVVYCDTHRKRSFVKKVKHYLSYLNPVTLLQHCQSRFLLPKFERKAQSQLATLLSQRYGDLVTNKEIKLQENSESDLEFDRLFVENINDPAVLSFVNDKQADMICVNGTNLVREPLLSTGASHKYGMINLHTGLSPYSRGGNCNLFMLLENQPQYIGATVHYIDKGIDSGDLIKTIRPEICADDTYEFIEAKVFLDGIEAVIDSIRNITHGKQSRVKQWEKGKLFLKRTGYQYRPYLRLRANKMIEKGVLGDYLKEKHQIDKQIVLVE